MTTGVEDDVLTSMTTTSDPSMRTWRRQRRTGMIAVTVAVLLGLIALGLALAEALPIDGTVELLAGISSVAAVTGTSLVLFLLLLISRWPVLERAFGQDQLVGWHKRLAPWAVYLIAAHVLLIITASAVAANRAWFAGLAVGLRSYPGFVPARRAHHHCDRASRPGGAPAAPAHETWWTCTAHLRRIVLAFFHQVVAATPSTTALPARSGCAVRPRAARPVEPRAGPVARSRGTECRSRRWTASPETWSRVDDRPRPDLCACSRASS
jgi:hypothetical protein